MDEQRLPSRQALALQAVPTADHLGGDSEIFGYRLDRVSFADLVARDDSRIGRRIGLLAGSDRDDQTAFGSERKVVEAVGLGNGPRLGVIGARDRGEGFSPLP